MGYPSNHRKVIGRVRNGLRYPDAFELAMVGLCVLAVAVMAIGSIRHYLDMTRSTETLVLASGIKTDLIVYHATYGHWPAADSSARTPTIIRSWLSTPPGRNTRSITLASNGAIIAHVALQPDLKAAQAAHARNTLTLRPVVTGTTGFHSVLFVCGHAVLPGDLPQPATPNLTTLSNDDLPPACRGPLP